MPSFARVSSARVARRGLLAGVAVGLILSLTALPGPVYADDEGETLIGTFDIPGPGDPGEAEAPTSATVQSGPGSAVHIDASPVERRAVLDIENVFSEALADLGAGQTKSAVRHFERVIAADPDGALATEARSYLADLYRPAAGAPEPANAARGVVARGAQSAPASRPQNPPLAPRDVLAPELSLPGEAPGHRAGLGPFEPVAASVTMRFIVEAGDRVFFSQGSAALGTRARAVLAAQARFLIRNPSLYAVIEGHTDDAPLTADEQGALSAARAEAVRNRLVSEGVTAGRLVIAPLARQRPVADCAGTSCQSQNRRAVTVLTPVLPSAARESASAAEDHGNAAPATAR